MSALDELLNANGTRKGRGCAICGEPTVAGIDVKVSRIGPGGKRTGAAGTTKTRTRTFCADHAVEVFTRLTVVLDATE